MLVSVKWEDWAREDGDVGRCFENVNVLEAECRWGCRASLAP